MYDNNPFATTKDVFDDLTKAFEGFSLKSTIVGPFISNECNLSIKRVTRHPVARNNDTKPDYRVKWVQDMAKTNMSFLQNCVFIDEARFDINVRSDYARSERNTPAVVTTLTTQAVSHTILGAIYAKGVVNIDIRVPQKPKKVKVAGGRKRKAAKPKDPVPRGTVTGHYLRFVSNTVNYMNEVLEMKGFYIVMDNAHSYL